MLLSHFSDSVRPHSPWDSSGKNTGVGYHFLLQCMKVKSESEVAQSCPTLRNTMDCSPPGSSVHGIFHARILEWVAMPSPSVSQKLFQSLKKVKKKILFLYLLSPFPSGSWVDLIL